MLQYRGFIRQDSATRSYLAGPTMDRLAFRVLREMDVRAKVHPVVEQINNSLLETVHVGQLVGDEVHFIDSMESSRALRVGTV